LGDDKYVRLGGLDGFVVEVALSETIAGLGSSHLYWLVVDGYFLAG
jgi:hypothetical protein